MLNIYRVISLSLVMSLFFAAPLLCIHPVSFQLRKEQRLAVKKPQAKRVAVAWQRGSHPSYIRATDGLANSLLQGGNAEDQLVEEQTAIPAVFVEGEAEDWDEEELQGLNGAEQTLGSGGVRAVSKRLHYY